ncbi:AbrB/MazE/SpoVT family DNA-binding domain-containing protein [Vulcanisaeta sp. JCM 16159]|uniref:AbrB/MazE/SpoVT family DNA-binding domain-containing protein n=1 Tax=Vulcanisaeta sp. JCM 16159 TaxID=1295371 RepID=UPI001FB475D1|nr:AbrB/MazE/SpoVT family DNA-binding domain-containing protein [Vulcanisaeta sp. JCM 16159]
MASDLASAVHVLARPKAWHNGRTTIPREVRAVLGIKDGDQIEWILKNGEIKVRRVVKNE